MATWLDYIELVMGDAAFLVVPLVAFLLALGAFKLVKDWLPF